MAVADGLLHLGAVTLAAALRAQRAPRRGLRLGGVGPQGQGHRHAAVCALDRRSAGEHFGGDGVRDEGARAGA